VSLAKELNIPVATVNSIVKTRKSIEKSAKECGPMGKKRKYVKYSKYNELEEILKTWFQSSRAAGIPISGVLLKEKALHAAARLGIEDFKASNGWIDRFKNRYNIVYKTICGESAGVNLETVSHWKCTTLSNHVDGYALKDIFNVDETGLFFNVLPHKTLDFKGDPCHGGKHSKARLTILLGANADGSERLRPFVLGKSKNPRCFKNIKSLPTSYAANSKAWMTSTIFEQQMHALDAKIGGQNRKIVLFMDQCPAHPVNLELRNIKLIFFPANCTSQLQPLDLGIIHAFKTNYRRILVRKLLTFIDCGRDPKTFKVSVLDALHFIARSWIDIKTSTIVNCFKKAGFSPQEIEEEENSCEQIETEWKNIESDAAFNEFVEMDKALLTSDTLTIDDTIDLCSLDNENAESDEEEPIPSSFQAMLALNTLRHYFSCVEGSEREYDLLYRLEKCVETVTQLRKSKQTNLFHFFHKEI
jgi:hypothetical protein